VYVESRGAHGHHAVGSFEALVGSLEPQLEEWLAHGVITDAQYRAVKDRRLPDS
jgi:hypothetical protein